jgi:acetylornithine deacetylase/succinyl-diaminopimelate desuccinylase-like protein
MVTEPSWCREEFERRQEEFLAEWAEAVRFPTVGADPNHWDDCQACALWYADRLRARGFTAEVLPTGDRTPPLVLAERPGRPDRPTLLIYGHYDVQPADSLEKWKTPPFEPVWQEGRLWGRGAQDNKGQLAYLLAALAAMHHRAPDAMPPLRLLLEGQEESGSSGLARCLPGLAERIRADVLLVCDTFMSPDGAPALVMGLRGIVHFTLTVFGPRRDLHSGTHGGVAPNPATGLCRMVAALHRPDGAPAVPGFEPPPDCPSAHEQELLARTPFDPIEYERQTGVPPVGGERALPPLVRLGFRPTIEVNGIVSGYTGAGSKTIIPERAVAKISARLAAGQDPERCLTLLEQFLRDHTPAGLRCEITEQTVGGPALRLDPDSPWAAAAARALEAVCGRPVIYQWEGASIPILAALSRAAGGAAPVLTGFGREEDAVHAPNESFALDRFRLGFRFVCSFLTNFGGFYDTLASPS